jgi:predicted lipoprotein with Yx(FWY)xxD motif
MAHKVGLRSFSRARIGRTGVAAAAALGIVAAPVLAMSTAGAASTTSAKLSAVKTTKGKVLADGTTVYTLMPSSMPCTATCLKFWPAVTLPAGTTHATAGPGVTASKLGSVTVTGVGLQVTYGGKKLYKFVEDKAPGQVNGDVSDMWGKWSAVVLSKAGASSAASKSKSSGSGSSSGSSSGSGGSTAGSGGVSF